MSSSSAEIKIASSIFGKPILRTEENKTEEYRKASWLDLFFDLFFVAAIRVISHEFSYSLDHWSRLIFTQTIIYIVAIRRLWTSITYFFERYKTQGLTKRLFMFVQMFLIAGIILAMMWWNESIQIFFLFYGIAKWLLAAMYLWSNVGHNDVSYCKNNLLQVYGNSIVLISSIIALFFSWEWTARILIAALILDVFIPILWRSTIESLPTLEIETYHERFGLFVIIVLGESILGAITGVHWEYINTSTISLIGAALLLSFVHWRIYFEYVSQADIIKKNILGWTYLHLPLTICFTLISSVILYLVEHSTKIISHGPITLLTICCIIIMITIMWFEKITGTYNALISKDIRYRRHMIVPIIGMLLLLPNRWLSSQTLLRLIAILAMIPIFIRAYLLTINYKKNQSLLQNK